MKVSNAIAQLDPAGRITRPYYDELNRPLTVTTHYLFAHATLTSTLASYTYTVDATGNRTQMVEQLA